MIKPILFCLPYAGGSANIFYDWINDFFEYFDVIPIEYRGHGKRYCDDFCENIEETIEDVFQIITNNDSVKKNLPYFIYGHSLGSIVAAEIGRLIALETQNPPRRIFLAGTRPPHLLYKDKRYTHLKSEEFMKEIALLGQLPDEIIEDKELCEFFCEIIYNDFKLIENYNYNPEIPIPNIPYTVLSGSDDDEAPKEDMIEWRKYTSSDDFAFHQLNGNHFFAFNNSGSYEKLKKLIINKSKLDL